MEYYVIINKPVVVRNQPSMNGKIINALSIDTIIKVNKEENGWLFLTNGSYVLKSENVIKKSLHDKQRILNGLTPLKLRNKPNSSVFNLIKIPTSRSATEINLNDRIKINEGTIKDPTTGNVIDSSFSQDTTILNVVSIKAEEGLIQVSDGGNNIFWVSMEDVQIKSKENEEWQDVDEEAIQEKAYEEKRKEEEMSFIDSIKELGNNLNNKFKSKTITVSSMRSIYGMPYQFLPTTDLRVDNTKDNPSQSSSFDIDKFGRKYNEKIVSRAPILVLQAGKPSFLSGFSEDTQDAFVEQLKAMVSLGTDYSSRFQQIAEQPGKYYCFKDDHVAYYDAINPILRAMSFLLGIGNETISINDATNKALSDINWADASAMGNTSFGINKGAVAFYINSDAQVQENFSNSSTQSQLASKINNIGQIGTELQFLLGGLVGTGLPGTGLIDGVQNNFLGANAITNFNMNDYRNSQNILSTIVGNFQTLLSGGRMIFPEIWSDSTFTKNYNVTLKFNSPDCDNLSIFLNILVPLIHILGMVMPRSAGYNSYISPWIVRAYYKSMFHIDMGLIVGCDIQYGDLGSWNQNGLPTEVTVQLTIKDLYNVLSFPLNQGSNDLIGNPMMLDYIANKCGVNISETDFLRTLKLWYITRGPGRLEDNVINGWRNIMNEAYSKWNNLFKEHWTM